MSYGWNYPVLHDPSRSIYAPPRHHKILIKREPELPVTVKEAVLYLRLDPEAENGPEKPLIESMLLAATVAAEEYAAIAIMQQDWRMTLRHLPLAYGDGLAFPLPPFLELLRFRVNNVEQPLSDYMVEFDDRGPSILYPVNHYWPMVYPRMQGACELVFRCGHEKPEETVPATVKQAILMAVATWYENRESVQQWTLSPLIELGWKPLLNPYRQLGFA